METWRPLPLSTEDCAFVAVRGYLNRLIAASAS